MRLLVSNDDGIAAPGLAVLVRALVAAGHEVTVAAPSSERSGSAMSLGVITDRALLPIAEDEVALPGVVRAVSVDAPPALAVRAGCLGCFGPPPELVVAGINPGFNTGRAVLHSGTVGAALAAVVLNRPGIAMSTARDSQDGLRTAAQVAVAAVAAIPAGEPPVAYNVNVPDRPAAAIADVAEATLSSESLVDIDLASEDGALRVRRVTREPPFVPGTDADLIARGVVAVSAITAPWDDPVDVGSLVQRVADTWR